MIYLELFWEFFKVGLFAFGGAYSAIPIIRDIVISRNWLNLELYTDLVALAESTPGPIMVNIPSYVGAVKGGFVGSLIASISAIIPAFAIILIFAVLFKNFMQNKKVQYVFSIIRPVVCAIILTAGLVLIHQNVFDKINIINIFLEMKNDLLSDFMIKIYKRILVLILIIICQYIYKKVVKKKMSSILLIFCSAILAICIF